MVKDTIRLTSLTKKGGCGCKINPQDLGGIINHVSNIDDQNLIVDFQNSDDAGVYKINENLGLVQTLDFFTPIVDDPYDFGQIAAANALSDVYAMGGQPRTALNIVAFPIKTLDKGILYQILEGANEKIREAGVVILGGHSIEDDEPKFGLSVSGLIDINHIYKNKGAVEGDVLVLTKPIGVGIMTTALKKGELNEKEILKVTKIMTQLNKFASEQLKNFKPNAVTDVTGFGLLGHSYEMALGSEVTFKIYSSEVPIIEEAFNLAKKNIIPGGTRTNRSYVDQFVRYNDSISEEMRYILCDAVTSGGLLISMSLANAQEYIKILRANEIHAEIIGEVETLGDKYLTIE